MKTSLQEHKDLQHVFLVVSENWNGYGDGTTNWNAVV